MLPLLLAALLLAKSAKDVDSSPIREAREALQEDLFTRALNYMKSNPETLEELMTREHAVLEGDIVQSTDRNAVESTWPTHEIPYVVSPELASRTDDFLSAMAMVSEHTCVSFHKRTSETNYLLFQTSKGCASYVGFIGGEQPVFVAPQCTVGNIIHEILHALGFHHEHTRTDREQHITILPSNILAGMERNFRKHKGQTFGLQYDVSSIMHYGSGFFSVNGLPTIISNGDTKDMGQRVRMTETDIQRVRRLYRCDVMEQEEEEKVEVEEEEEEGGGAAGAAGAAETEEDTNVPVRIHNVTSAIRTEAHVSADKPKEDHTSTTASSAASLQRLTATTRGQNNTNTEKT